MAKTFDSLNRNKNTGSSLDKVIKEVAVSDESQEQEEIYRNFTFKIPKQWHQQLKYDLSRTYNKTIQELITDALKNTYSELK